MDALTFRRGLWFGISLAGVSMSHTFSSLLVHVTFSTKDRLPLIKAEMRERLFVYMNGVSRREFGTSPSIGGVEDHMHGLLALPPDLPVSHAMNRWKSISSGWMRKQGVENFAWQTGYAAFSVSASMADRVQRYIASQVQHHRRLTFKEELVALLKRHRITYDPERLWE